MCIVQKCCLKSMRCYCSRCSKHMQMRWWFLVKHLHAMNPSTLASRVRRQEFISWYLWWWSSVWLHPRRRRIRCIAKWQAAFCYVRSCVVELTVSRCSMMFWNDMNIQTRHHQRLRQYCDLQEVIFLAVSRKYFLHRKPVVTVSRWIRYPIIVR